MLGGSVETRRAARLPCATPDEGDLYHMMLDLVRLHSGHKCLVRHTVGLPHYLYRIRQLPLLSGQLLLRLVPTTRTWERWAYLCPSPAWSQAQY